jgi:dimethylglycine oxidase
MQNQARIVIVGAGIVGCSAAYFLTQRGWRDVVVIDQGPLFATGGSTSHAPGLVFQTNSSRSMSLLAQASVATYNALRREDDTPCFYGVGSLEVAHTPERWQDLRRKIGFARACGLEAALIGPEEAARMLPLLDASRIQGAYYVPSDGIAKAVWAAEAMAKAATARGASFYGNVAVEGFDIANGRVRAVLTAQGRIDAEQVLICGGIWGPKIARMAGIHIPLTPCQHQYVRTTPLPQLAGATREATHPILRMQDKDMYARQHGDCYGIGSYQHEPMLTDAEAIRAPGTSPMMPSVMPFTPEHFEQPWRDAVELLPALAGAELTDCINGMFSFTPDSYPVLGPAPSVAGLWIAEAVWVTQGAGVGQVMAEWLDEGAPSLDLHEADSARFEGHALSKRYILARGAQQYREVYDIIHPRQGLLDPRPIRTSPFYAQQQALGAVFFEARGWERPQWYGANAPLLTGLAVPTRDPWGAQLYSPIAAAEHLATRERVALFDMTPLPRCEVSGPGALALLERLTTSRMNRKVGSVAYTAMLNAKGGIRSDITVARLGAERFQVGCNGLHDLAWFQQHAPPDGSVTVRDLASELCCVGVWGPRARDLLAPLVEGDLSTKAFPYFSARQLFVGEVPVLAMRVSYVGELGYELYAPTEYGRYLWELLWQAGQAHGVVAGGRAAFDQLRLEKGYRLWGQDMTEEHTPDEAGIGFVVNEEKGDFVGRDALLQRRAHELTRKLCCLVLDDRELVLLGKEPIYASGRVASYVTSAAYGYSVNHSIAYGYLPVEHAQTGSRVEVEYFGERYGACVAPEPLWDAQGERLRA